MFNANHYVPVLRWKRAERAALRELRNQERANVTPLVELTPKNFGHRDPFDPEAVSFVMRESAVTIKQSWGDAPFFLDLIHLPAGIRSAHGSNPLLKLGEECRTLGASLIPVTGLGRPTSHQVAVKSVTRNWRSGLAVRLMVDDIDCPGFSGNLISLVGNLEVDSSQVDIVIDCGMATGTHTVSSVCGSIPYLDKWRTLTYLSGAFPKDLSEFEPGQHLIERSDWVSWRTAVANDPMLTRTPSFGDYTIQHAIYVEPPSRANFSASIRYTTDNSWLIMRGEGVFNDEGPGFAQWPANAQLLVERPEFCGPDFSYGDSYIAEMSSQTMKTGNAETWLRAGINHHITMVSRQISSLGDL